MIHNLKKPDGTIEAVDCKIGTGVFDRNGNEIFEDDRVRVTYQPRQFYFDEVDVTVKFADGTFVVEEQDTTLANLLSDYEGIKLEIVND